MSVSVEPLNRFDPSGTLAELLAAHDDFWDGRDTRALLQPQWFRQFGRYGLLARDGDRPVGYLLGVVTASGIGYVQAVAVRVGYRRTGLGRRLWAVFAADAATAGAAEVQAITTPGNLGSIAFHTGLGMTAEEIPDYSGPGQDRVRFRRVLCPQ
jgi:ribosomal protein S18 acetylase RimI-like enzyme